jgi:hypothetical protein
MYQASPFLDKINQPNGRAFLVRETINFFIEESAIANRKSPIANHQCPDPMLPSLTESAPIVRLPAP